MKEKNGQLMKIAQAGLMAALCYIGYAVFPAISASGTKIHIGNAFVVLSAYLLGGVYGGRSGAVLGGDSRQRGRLPRRGEFLYFSGSGPLPF